MAPGFGKNVCPTSEDLSLNVYNPSTPLGNWGQREENPKKLRVLNLVNTAGWCGVGETNIRVLTLNKVEDGG